MADTITVYISVGNSDDKLTQADWSTYVTAVMIKVGRNAAAIHGEWYSDPTSAYQNACVCAEIPTPMVPHLRYQLDELRGQYKQDSISWAVTPRTEFIGHDEEDANHG